MSTSINSLSVMIGTNENTQSGRGECLLPQDLDEEWAEQQRMSLNPSISLTCQRATMKGFYLLSLSCALIRFFNVQDNDRILQDGGETKQYQMLKDILTVSQYLLSIAVMIIAVPYMIVRYQMRYRYFYFWSVLATVPCVLCFGLVAIIIGGEQICLRRNTEVLPIVLFAVIGFIQKCTYVYQQVYAIGYMLDLVEQRRGKRTSTLLIIYLLPYTMTRVLIQLLGFLKYQGSLTCDGLYIVVMCCTISGVALSIAVPQFQMRFRRDNESFFKAYKVLTRREFWPLIIVLVSYKMLIGFQEFQEQFLTYAIYNKNDDDTAHLLFSIFILFAIVSISVLFQRKMNLNLDFLFIVAIVFNLALSIGQLTIYLESPQQHGTQVIKPSDVYFNIGLNFMLEKFNRDHFSYKIF